MTDNLNGASETGGDGASTIADLSYRNYGGELRTRAARWWIVALATLRANINRRRLGYWIPAALIALVYLIQGAIFYTTEPMRRQMAALAIPVPAANPYASTMYDALAGTTVLLLVAALTVGAGSIAADNRANALLIYLSKPITPGDYLAGKWMGVFLLLLAASLLPALLMYLFFLTAYTRDGFLQQNPWIFFRMLGATALPAALHASLIVGFSAWSKSPRMAGAIYAAFYFGVAILAGIGGHLLTSRAETVPDARAQARMVRNLSVSGVIHGTALHLYQIDPRPDLAELRREGRRQRRARREAERAQAGAPGAGDAPVEGLPPAEEERLLGSGERPPLAPLLVLGGVFLVLPVAAARARIRAVEIVRG